MYTEQFKRIRVILFAVGALLLLVSNHADFLLQADAWQWHSYVDLSHRAPHWPWYLDWIPHDPWHWVQFLHNNAGLAGATLMAVGEFFAHLYYRKEAGYKNTKDEQVTIISLQLDTSPAAIVGWSILFLLVTYGVTRALGFTLFYHLLNGF